MRSDSLSLGTPPPTELRSARLQVHWAAQVVSATADRWLLPQSDDGHTSMEWRSGAGALVGNATQSGVRLALALRGFALHVIRGDRTIATLALAGHTLAEAMRWADAQVATAEASRPRGIHARDYDMPDHPVRSGGAFIDEPAALAALERWFAAADRVLREVAAREPTAIAVRIWPHHFDIGSIIYLEEPSASARQIGFGLSPGDAYYDQPYFYVTASPLPAVPRFSALAAGGFWRDRPPFVGAVLLGGTLVTTPDPHATARAFLDSAIGAARMLLAPQDL